MGMNPHYIMLYKLLIFLLVQDGASKIAKLPKKWLRCIVYGRYSELVHGYYNGLETNQLSQ